MKVEIVGLHKADVLLALYDNARCQGKAFDTQPVMKIMGKMSMPGSVEKAKAEIEKCSKNNNYYFDYIDLGGGPKPLKVDLAGFDFDPSQYDSYHGSDGYAAKIVGQLRSEVVNQLKDAPKDSIAFLLSKIGSAFMAQQNNQNSGSDNKEEAKPESPRPRI